MNLHLFFDVYIEDAPLGVYLRGDRRRFEIDHRIRTAALAYGFQTKFDITRYTLDSYVDIPWSSATIRIECGNPEYEAIYSDLALKFPAASIVRHRSDTAKKYFDALNQLPLSGDSWIFFSPNNDHPFLNHHDRLAHVLADADDAAVRTGADIVSIPYSHFTESMNTFRPTHHDWGIYGGVFPKFLYETEHSYVVQSNKLLLDSLHIYRLADLKWMFGQSQKTGRVIRPEDTEFYLTDVKSHVLVLPKFEFCRHYDGYSHIADKVPPLFIPPGYFEKNIRIRYGYDERRKGYIHINPTAHHFSFQDPGGADLKILRDDIPRFWKDRISELDINPDYVDPSRDQLSYYLDLQNPWRGTPKIVELLRSLRKRTKYRLRGHS